jgi:NAD+ diphosphatase
MVVNDRLPLAVWNGRILVVPPSHEPVAVDSSMLGPAAAAVTLDEGVRAAIVDAPDARAALAALGAPAGGDLSDVMFDLGGYAPDLRRSIVRAIAIERWSARHRFCSVCAAPLAWRDGGPTKICTRPERPHIHFPRLDPAVIVLVTDGERALLGRQARWPRGFYSTIAGFVEPAETIEDAVRREVAEETSIAVGAVRYFGSEPWPFPASLMLGFFADATSRDIVRADAELEDARWFDPRELSELQTAMKAERPHGDTIARRLIDAWLAQYLR